jgi:hypothetical protein
MTPVRDGGGLGGEARSIAAPEAMRAQVPDSAAREGRLAALEARVRCSIPSGLCQQGDLRRTGGNADALPAEAAGPWRQRPRA